MMMWTDDPVLDAERYFSERESLPHLEDIDGEYIYEGDEYYEIDGVIYAPSTLQGYRKTYFPD